MGKAVFVNDGKTIQFKATKEVSYGDVVVLDGRIGIAAMTIAKGESGTVSIVGAYEFKKATGAIKPGAKVFYKEADGTITTSDSDTPAGIALEASEANAGTVVVKIG